MGTGQIHRDSFEKLTEDYFKDINDCYSKKCLQEIVKHYTELIYQVKNNGVLADVIKRKESQKLWTTNH